MCVCVVKRGDRETDADRCEAVSGDTGTLVGKNPQIRFAFHSIVGGSRRLWQTAVPSFRPDRVYVGDVEEDRRSRLCKTESPNFIAVRDPSSSSSPSVSQLIHPRWLVD